MDINWIETVQCRHPALAFSDDYATEHRHDVAMVGGGRLAFCSLLSNVWRANDSSGRSAVAQPTDHIQYARESAALVEQRARADLTQTLERTAARLERAAARSAAWPGR